ncbi:MAG: translation initiation factor Sui1 [Magnetococcales bacterium]|nr:translation initiation factor Sui1 [Magnetococcales bacterium]
MNSRKTTDRVVYSTEQGKMCPECGNPSHDCICRKQKSSTVSDGVVRVSRETKGRKGKGVTVIKGLALDGSSLIKLAKKLKTICGSGGTVKDGVIELQGDHIATAIDYLKKHGLNVKRSGG